MSTTSEPVNVIIWLMCAYFRFIIFLPYTRRKNRKQHFSSFQLIANNYKARLDSWNLEWSQKIQPCLSSDECSTIAKNLSPNGFIITESLLSRKSNQEISLRNWRNRQRRNRKLEGSLSLSGCVFLRVCQLTLSNMFGNRRLERNFIA